MSITKAGLLAGFITSLVMSGAHCSNPEGLTQEDKCIMPTIRYSVLTEKVGFVPGDERKPSLALLTKDMQYFVGRAILGSLKSLPSAERKAWIEQFALSCRAFANLVDQLPNLKVAEGVTAEQFLQLIRHKTNLKKLTLAHCYCSPVEPKLSLLGGLQQLEELQLNGAYGCTFRGLRSQLARSAPNLKTLILGSMTCTTSPNFPNGSVELPDHQDPKAKLANLSMLVLGSTDDDFAQELSDFITGCPNLTCLSDSNFGVVDDQVLGQLMVACPLMTHLDKSETSSRGCSRVSAQAMIKMAKVWPNLLNPNLYGAFLRKTEQEQMDLVIAFPHMTQIELDNVSGEVARRVASMATDLRKLNLRACQTMTLTDILDTMAANPKLDSFGLEYREEPLDAPADFMVTNSSANIRHLNFESCGGLTDNGALALVRACPKLQTLKFRNFFPDQLKSLSINGLNAILNVCKETLTDLDISYFHTLTEDQIIAIINSMPKLENIIIPSGDITEPDTGTLKDLSHIEYLGVSAQDEFEDLTGAGFKWQNPITLSGLAEDAIERTSRDLEMEYFEDLAQDRFTDLTDDASRFQDFFIPNTITVDLDIEAILKAVKEKRPELVINDYNRFPNWF